MERKKYGETGFQSQKSIKILGILFKNGMEETIKINGKMMHDKIKGKCIQAMNREFTLTQRILFTNTYVTPIIINTASILPIPKMITNELEKIISNFIWTKQHERLAKEECYPRIKDGGLGIVSVHAKARAHYAHTLLKQYLSD